MRCSSSGGGGDVVVGWTGVCSSGKRGEQKREDGLSCAVVHRDEEEYGISGGVVREW